jgi:Fur family ferric uptake transcriptional regulator
MTDSKMLFSDKGLKNTKNRQLVLGVLREAELPLTAEDIYLCLKEVDATLSLSTVYRILDIFVEKELALKAGVAKDNAAMYELNDSSHKHHLVCLNCKKIQRVYNCPLEDFEKNVAKETDFSITGHRLELYGYCPECQKNL